MQREIKCSFRTRADLKWTQLLQSHDHGTGIRKCSLLLEPLSPNLTLHQARSLDLISRVSSVKRLTKSGLLHVKQRMRLALSSQELVVNVHLQLHLNVHPQTIADSLRTYALKHVRASIHPYVCLYAYIHKKNMHPTPKTLNSPNL